MAMLNNQMVDEFLEKITGNLRELDGNAMVCRCFLRTGPVSFFAKKKHGITRIAECGLSVFEPMNCMGYQLKTLACLAITQLSHRLGAGICCYIQPLQEVTFFTHRKLFN